MDDNKNDNQIKLANIFMPYAKKRSDEIKKRKGRFVHYTSAENAIKIIQSKKLWMRNARCMNDYMEVSHGHELLVNFFKNPNGGELFVKALAPCGERIAENAIGLFDKWWNNIQSNTFISSISEHDSDEDFYGRLSMWRAYGTQSEKAAIVLNLPLESRGATKALNIFLVPTAYFNQDDMEKEFTDVINNIKDNIDFLISQDSKLIIQMVFAMLLVTTVSLKHKGFKEEREWRVIYLPEMEPSILISRKIETINGVPQSVYQIPLEDNPKENVSGIAIPQLVEKIIIGPTMYPLPIYDAFKVVLKEAGIGDVESRIIVSNIPLRT